MPRRHRGTEQILQNAKALLSSTGIFKKILRVSVPLWRVRCHQNPRNFHQANPAVSQIAMLAIDT